MPDEPERVEVRVVAPDARSVRLVELDPATGAVQESGVLLQRDGDSWIGTVFEGAVYGLIADGDGARFDPSKVLLDPQALEVWFSADHDRWLAAERGASNAGRGPMAVARRTPPARPSHRSSRPPVVYELHVRGMTRRAGGPHPGTLRGLVEQLPRLAALGVTVIELLPVHQNDPAEGSYWGYMPLAFAAVQRDYSVNGDAAAELAAFVAAAHDHDIEVWLDVVFNHTTEVDAAGPTYAFRGLSDGSYYRLRDDGSYIETTGCGNDVDAESPVVQDLVLWSLERLADVGIDGFRFDLAVVLGRSATLVERIERLAHERGLTLVAEPWDAAGDYQLGGAWPGRGWLQWNDRFREDARGFLRGEPGMLGALRQRVQGSPDLFDTPMESVNFVACHDGFTLYDVVAYDHKHNEDNGWSGADGASENRSWNCGWEGDDGVPDEVLALRRRQLRNAWCLLALSHGVPMAGMGDELGRTQGGNNNAYNQDNETSWVDWDRAIEFADLERFVSALVAVRARHPVLAQPTFWGDAVRFSEPDAEGRALTWQVGDLYVLANAWWEPVDVALEEPGPWRRIVDTSLEPPEDIVDQSSGARVGTSYRVAARTTVVLERLD